MDYKVIHPFVDKDNGREYKSEDVFDTKGKTDTRLKELSTKNNNARTALIQAVKEPTQKGKN